MRIQVRQRRIHHLLRRWLTLALHAVDPHTLLPQQVQLLGSVLTIGSTFYPVHPSQKIVIGGAGKASPGMAKAMETILGQHIHAGVVGTIYGHTVPTRYITIREAGHPVPDRASQSAGRELLRIVSNLTKHDLLIVLLSGGASSLLTVPAPGLTLTDKRRTTQLLLRSGATITEVNTVRKHLSAIKGGKLAWATRASVENLILSDVVGDRVEDIGSGPTAYDSTTYKDARRVLQRYNLWNKVPTSIQGHVLKGIRRTTSVQKPTARSLASHVHHTIIGNNRIAVEAVAEAAIQSGFHSLMLTTSLVGEACEAAKWFGSLAREIILHQRPVARPCCVIAGGELTVTRQGRGQGQGKGGRAQEFALAAALHIRGLQQVWVAAFGTDGIDGPTEVAGAVVDGTTALRARQDHIDLEHALTCHDSYHVLRRLRCHITTGPTGTNVNDLYLLVVL